mgnify:CR=1 FL=1
MDTQEIFKRTRLLIGDSAMQQLSASSVIVFGVGGVGSWCAEALIRSGVGRLTIVDCDCVAPSNINRQLMATTQTVGQPKVAVLARRLLEINPNAEIETRQDVFCEDTSATFHLESYDYIIDAIDSLRDKLLLITLATQIEGTRFFSSMGAALKLDPTRVKVANFWNVKCDPLGRMLRKRLRQRRLMPERSFLCVYSDEMLQNQGDTDDETAQDVTTAEGLSPSRKAVINGSMVHITAIFGMTLAGLVVQDAVEKGKNEE